MKAVTISRIDDDVDLCYSGDRSDPRGFGWYLLRNSTGESSPYYRTGAEARRHYLAGTVRWES